MWATRYWPAATAAVLVGGMAASVLGATTVASSLWLGGLIVTGTPVVARTVRAAGRGRFATDIIAMIAIVTAVLLRQPVAGLVIVLMQTGGEALERFAEGKASAAVRLLEEATPSTAHRLRGTNVEDVTAISVLVGETLVVRPGEQVPANGVVVEGESELDTAALTGEAAPLAATAGTQLLSGMINRTGTFHMRVTALARDSQYSRIVELVRTAQASKAPIQRLADRWAIWLTPMTLLVCVIAYAATGDWSRVLAVLVVATPCPLILAAPIAFLGGVNKAARAHVIVRHGSALERLSQLTVIAFDKTGTLTVGRPVVSRVVAVPPDTERDVLRNAEAAEHGFSHQLARVIADYAAERLTDRDRTSGSGFREQSGGGVEAMVDGRRVHVGSSSYMLRDAGVAPSALANIDVQPGTVGAYVAVDGRVIGMIECADPLRPRLPALLARLDALGVRKRAILSGDRASAVAAIGAQLGFTEAHGELLPGEKAAVIARYVDAGEIVAMVGDGTNDAPALSAADVGIAFGGHGRGITVEAADVILLIDEVGRVGDIIAIARRTVRIAKQSIESGLALSAVAMVFAALGYLQPIAGSVLQEAIDVAVILNALRAAR